MNSNGPSGRVTSSTGDVDLLGELVGQIPGRRVMARVPESKPALELVRECGTSLEPPPYVARPRLDDRLAAACSGDDLQAAAVRRLLRCPS